MKISDIRDSFVNDLYVALETFLGRTELKFAGESVYAFVLYGSNACRGLGVAMSTREALARRNDNIGADPNRTLLNTIDAAEWEYINRDYQLFGILDQDVRAAYDVFYEGQLEDVDLDSLVDNQLQEFISNFFVQTIADAINRLKTSEKLKSIGEPSQLLFGVFTDDPCNEDLDITERVSAQVNTAEWHQEVMKYCTLMRTSA